MHNSTHFCLLNSYDATRSTRKFPKMLLVKFKS